jgi:hypothetical protein
MKKIAIFIVIVAIAGLGKDHKDHNRNSESFDRQYHSIIPLGAERIDLRPSTRTLFILATAESPFFEGWHSPVDAHYLLKADGSRVEAYPREIGFRLTATAMRPDMLLLDPYGTLNLPDGSINDYLLHLQFRMTVFHGLETTSVEPESVRLIGMPADVNYDERIYQMLFNLPHQIPITDRIVIEVLAPTGYRICKFHLDLF